MEQIRSSITWGGWDRYCRKSLTCITIPLLTLSKSLCAYAVYQSNLYVQCVLGHIPPMNRLFNLTDIVDSSRGAGITARGMYSKQLGCLACVRVHGNRRNW